MQLSSMVNNMTLYIEYDFHTYSLIVTVIPTSHMKILRSIQPITNKICKFLAVTVYHIEVSKTVMTAQNFSGKLFQKSYTGIEHVLESHFKFKFLTRSEEI